MENLKIDKAKVDDIYIDVVNIKNKYERKIVRDIASKVVNIAAIKEFIALKDDYILCAVAENESASLEILEEIVDKTNNSSILRAVAGNKNASSKLLEIILDKTKDKWVCISILVNKNVSTSLLEKIFSKYSNNKNILKIIAKNESATPELLEKIYDKNKNMDIKEAIAGNSNTPEDILNNIFKEQLNEGQAAILIALAQNKVRTLDVIDLLIQKHNINELYLFEIIDDIINDTKSEELKYQLIKKCINGINNKRYCTEKGLEFIAKYKLSSSEILELAAGLTKKFSTLNKILLHSNRNFGMFNFYISCFKKRS